ncbi:MAG: creatininase family protein [Anaerolineales bacterium]|jgi:creatinine amidohydrolase
MSAKMWNTLTTADFSTMDREHALVVLPSGSTEQHGPQLPVGTDTFIVEELIRRIQPQVADLELLFLPTLWCTKSNEHEGFAGSVYLQAETLMAVMHDLAASIAKSGFKKLILFNWHGGNSNLLSVLARDIRQRQKLMVFVVDSLWLFDKISVQSQEFDIHAGRLETSVLLAAHAEWVKPGPYENLGSDLKRGRLAESFSGYQYLLPEGGPVYIGWETADLTDDGVVGNPQGSNAQEGEQFLEQSAAMFAAIFHEIAGFDFQT